MARASRNTEDHRIASARQEGDALEITLSATGIEQLEADPAALLAELELGTDRRRLRSNLSDSFQARFTAPDYPKILHLREAPGRAVLVGELPADARWLQGHFPDDPVLPGVAQLHWAIGFAQVLLSIEGRFQGIDALKFQHIMQPGRCFTLLLEYSAERSRLRFEYRHATGHFSQGRVRFSQVNGDA